MLAGGVLAQDASWRVPVINVPIALLAAVAASRVAARPVQAEQPDTTSPALCSSTAGVISLVYGFTKAVTDGWSSTPTFSLISVGSSC